MLKNSAKIFSHLFFFVVVLISRTNGESIHDLLPKFGLPKGLVPDSVTSYSLSDDGTFHIELKHSCYVKFDDLVYYDKKISGKISYGKITGLSGIQAEKLFLWVSVTGIQMVSPDYIAFQVGIVSQKFPVKQFESIRTCKNRAFQEIPEISVSEV